MVTIENYEEYLMLDADGELDGAGKEALLAFIAANPALKEEYDAWQSLKLQPDLAQTYPDKGQLLKREPKGRVLLLKPYTLAAAAAVLAMIILIPALRERIKQNPSVAHALTDAPALPVKDVYLDSAARTPPPARKEQPRKTRRPGGTPAGNRLAAHHEPPVIRAASADSVAPLLATASVPVRVAEQVLSQAPEALSALSGELPGNSAPRQPLISWAPENRQAFQQLKAAVGERLAQASSAARTVKETALVIKLGNGSVNLNF